MKNLILIVSLALVGCPGQTLFPKCDDPAHPCPPVDPNYPTSERDGIGTSVGDACQVLRGMGCTEGQANRKGRTCFEVYSDAAKLAHVPSDCIKRATTVSQVRACGDFNSVRVRCDN